MPKSKRPFKARLAELMAEHNPPLVGATALGRAVGVRKQTAEKWIKGRSPKMGATHLFLLSGYFKVSGRWLWLEEGPKENRAPVSADGDRLLRYFESLADDERQALLTLAQNLPSRKQSGEQ